MGRTNMGGGEEAVKKLCESDYHRVHTFHSRIRHYSMITEN